MKCVVGLGNPGQKYAKTRHNVGFLVLEKLSQVWDIPLSREGFSSRYGKGRVGEEEVLLLLPMTYMNLSGRAVREVFHYYRLSLEDLLVVSDDLHLPLGRLRFRPRGSSGGQKGLQSIIDALGSQDFPRLRIGIGPVPGGVKWEDFVLSPFGEKEWEVVMALEDVAVRGISTWVEEGISQAMQKFNGCFVSSSEEAKKSRSEIS